MRKLKWSPQHSPREVKPSQLFSEALSWFSYCALGRIFPGESLGIQGIPQNPRSPDSFSQASQWLSKEWHQASTPVQMLPSILEVPVVCGVTLYSPGKHGRSKTKLNILYSFEESLGNLGHTNILQAGFFNYTLKEHSSPLSWYASYTAVSVATQWWHEKDWRVRQINEITLTHGMTMTQMETKSAWLKRE